MKQQFGGVWPAMLTPMNEAVEPALDVVDQLVDLFVEQQMGGLYVLGSTGQGPLLGVAERKSVAERAIKASAGRIPVMLHVGAVATEDAIELARHAAEIGADAISSVGPIYYRLSQDAVFDHYRRIGSASDLPFFVYHLSTVNTLTFGGREYVERLLDLPNIAGMKYTDSDLYQLGLIHEHAGERLQLFSGADQLLCQAALSGAIGAIGTFYNIWGRECLAAREAVVSGSFEPARRFMLTFQNVLNEIIQTESTWSFLRSAMQVRFGIDVGIPRLPLGLSQSAWKQADVERLLVQMEEATP